MELHAANITEPRDKSSHRGQLLRPGLEMVWGLADDTLPLIPANGNTAAFFVFFIGDERTQIQQKSAKGLDIPPPSGGMLFFTAGSTPPKLDKCRRPVFHVTLAMDDGVLENLLSSDASNNFAQAQLLAAHAGSSHVALALSSAARFNVESIRRCPFAGACRELALAARGFDLLANFIAALEEERQPDSALHFPLDHTLTLIRAAAARLQSDLEQPPSIAKLAGAVGLSESTLKRGFRQLYQTTPFGYLRARRMEHARELLATGKVTVLEAATFVGYSNPSNFAAAFRKQFGVNPKTFQMSAHR